MKVRLISWSRPEYKGQASHSWQGHLPIQMVSHDFWKSRSWEIKVYFKPKKNSGSANLETLKKSWVCFINLKKNKVCRTRNFSRIWNRPRFLKNLIKPSVKPLLLESRIEWNSFHKMYGRLFKPFLSSNLVFSQKSTRIGFQVNVVKNHC